MRRTATAAMSVLIALFAQTSSASQPLRFAAVGDAPAECKGGVWVGYPRQLRNTLGCLLARSAGLEGKLPADVNGRAAAIKAALDGGSFRGLGDELLHEWAEEPAKSLVPHDSFRPVGIVAIAFAPTSTDRASTYINPTGVPGGGMVFREYVGDYAFKAQLLASVDGRQVIYSVHGIFRPSNRGSRILAFERGSEQIAK